MVWVFALGFPTYLKLFVGATTVTLWPLDKNSLIKGSLKFNKDKPLLAIIKICFIIKKFFSYKNNK